MTKKEDLIAGVDGCKAGWIVITNKLGTAEFEAVLFSDFESLSNSLQNASVIAVDMPIILSDEASRLCDVKARQLLSKRASTIFSAPAKQLLNCNTYVEANELSKALFEKGISKQAWYLFPKIREIIAVQKNYSKWSKRLYECHPELSFRMMNQGEVLLDSKKGEVGKTKRLRLIEKAFNINLNDSLLSQFKKSEVTTDDILDAFACLWTAARIVNKESISVGESKMQIVF